MLLPFTLGLIETSPADCEMAALADRHYSRQKIGARQFLRNGRKLVLRNAPGTVLFAWIFQQVRMDGQKGYNCAIFRNESSQRASEIILEAEQRAFARWGPCRIYTYIDPRQTAPIIRHGERIVGYSFRKAGWKPLVSKGGKQRTSKKGNWLFVKLDRARPLEPRRQPHSPAPASAGMPS